MNIKISKIKTYTDEITSIENNIENISKELKIYDKLKQNYKMLNTELDRFLRYINSFSYDIKYNIYIDKS